MRSINLAQLSEFSKILVDDAIAEAAALQTHSTRVDHIKAAGYKVTVEQAKVLFRAEIHRTDVDGTETLVAHGMSDTPADALLHAILGYCREEYARRMSL